MRKFNNNEEHICGRSPYYSRIRYASAADADYSDVIVDMEALVMITCCIDSVYNHLMIFIFNLATHRVFFCLFQHFYKINL